MKIKYEFADGTVSEVEVDESIGTVIIEDRRREDNLARKERYHCRSLDAAEFEGMDYAAEGTPETLLAGVEEDRHLYEAFGQLSKVQRRRILMLAGGMSVNEIARKEGVHHSVVSETVVAARKKFKKFF
ncbi:RNA polymerase sigma factor [Enterocloster citroniae]|uniref:RNA polymerase sigma factor n=1 Tax=Enterocloster citroniae TaxID=358743 RepID=UPI00189BD0FB